MAKNCTTCKQLEWVDGECLVGSDSGFLCIKRHANAYDAEEVALSAKMNSEAYRNRYKRCYEPEEPTF